MFELIKNGVEIAKTSENHEYYDLIDNSWLAQQWFFVNRDEIFKYLEDNHCTIQVVAEGTMTPKLTIKYNG